MKYLLPSKENLKAINFHLKTIKTKVMTTQAVIKSICGLIHYENEGIFLKLFRLSFMNKNKPAHIPVLNIRHSLRALI